MREITHYLFSAGLSIYLLSDLKVLTAPSLLAAAWLSVSVNFVIDAVGHVSRNGAPSRSWITHSVFIAPAWGSAVGALTLAAITKFIHPSPYIPALALWTSVGALVAAGHLFLDSLTGAGIFFTRRRIALAHFRYDNPVLNLGFGVFGVGLMVAALH